MDRKIVLHHRTGALAGLHQIDGNVPDNLTETDFPPVMRVEGVVLALALATTRLVLYREQGNV